MDDTIKKNDLIFDIDWQGTKKLSQFSNLKLIKLYLITENKTELKKRLIKRNLDTKNEVEKRFKSFEEDIKHWNDYDYVIINKNLDTCFKQIEKIILKNKEKKNLFILIDLRNFIINFRIQVSRSKINFYF